jgi:uncharacterized metal-binding protein
LQRTLWKSCIKSIIREDETILDCGFWIADFGLKKINKLFWNFL